MQAVYMHEDEGSSSGGTDPMGAVICAVGISRYLEEEHVGRSGGGTISQIRYLLVVILELNGVSEVQYKGVMMIDDGKYQ